MLFDKFYKSTKLSILTIIVFALVAYGLSLPNKFLWDDEEQIVANPQIHSLSNIPNLFTSGIVNSQSGNLTGGYYRPMLTTTYSLLYVMGKGSPLTFRLFQILLHAINSVLVFYLFRKLLGPKLAFWGSIIFAVHPGISEAVLFNSGLGEPLFTLFTLTAVLAIIKYHSKPHVKYLVLTGAFILSGLLTKETAIIFFPLTLSLYYFIYKIKNITKPQTITLIVSVSLYFLLRIQALGKIMSTSLNFPTPFGQASTTQKLLTMPYELAFYLSTSILPYKLAIQKHTVIKEVNDINFWGSVLLVGLFLVTVTLYIRPKKTSLFFLSWFCLSIFPALNLIPLSSTVSERWLYFPVIGLIGIFLVGAKTLSQYQPRLTRILPLIFFSLIMVFIIKTISRNIQWRDGYSLYSNDLKTNPDSYDLQNNYGVELYRHGKIDESEKYFIKSIDLNPYWWTAYNNLGAIEEEKGNYDKAKLLYQKSIDTGNYYLAYENLAELYIKEKNYPEAEKFLENTLKYYPTSYKLRVYYVMSLYAGGKYPQAQKEASILIRYYPTQESISLFNMIMNQEKLPD